MVKLWYTIYGDRMLESALKLLKELTSHDYKAYIVGGFVRDYLLGRESQDIDVCTNATPKEIKEVFEDSFLPTEDYGSVVVNKYGVRFEITTFRKEFSYQDHRKPVEIQYIDDLYQDLLRRDFTINTLCIDSNGQVIDLLNAKRDIDNKIIRCVGNAKKKIKEDILRSLRAIRFATILDFKLDDELKKVIKKNGYLLKKLSYYRKKEELEKIFASPNCRYGLDLILELKLEDKLELSNLKNLVITTSSLGIWAQLDVLDIYNFSSHEKEIINGISQALKEEFNNHTLYKYGLYICTLVGEIKKIDRSLIVKKYNELPIFSVKDIRISATEICSLLNKKPGSFIKDIYIDLENKILDNVLKNDYDQLCEYVKQNY